MPVKCPSAINTVSLILVCLIAGSAAISGSGSGSASSTGTGAAATATAWGCFDAVAGGRRSATGAFSGWNPVAITVIFTESPSASLRMTPKLI